MTPELKLNFLSAIDAINPAFLWIGFAVVFCIAGIASAVLVYHWRTYAFQKNMIIVESLYFGGTLFFVIGAGISLFLFTTV